MLIGIRTTITIEDDVIGKAKSVATRLHAPFRRVVNEALRAGLKALEVPATGKPYCTKPHKMGLKSGINLDNVQELLAQVEGEKSR